MRTSVEFVTLYGTGGDAVKVKICDDHGELKTDFLLEKLRKDRTSLMIPQKLVEEIILELQALKATRITLEKVIRELKGGHKNVTEEVAEVYWETLNQVRDLQWLQTDGLRFTAMKKLEEREELQQKIDELTAEYEEIGKELKKLRRERDGNVIYFK